MNRQKKYRPIIPPMLVINCCKNMEIFITIIMKSMSILTNPLLQNINSPENNNKKIKFLSQDVDGNLSLRQLWVTACDMGRISTIIIPPMLCMLILLIYDAWYEDFQLDIIFSNWFCMFYIILLSDYFKNWKQKRRHQQSHKIELRLTSKLFIIFLSFYLFP